MMQDMMKYDAAKSEIENKIADASRLVKKRDYKAKITEIEGKIPSISGFATNVELIAVENKITKISSLVKKKIITQKLLQLKENLLIFIMINIS